MHHTRNGFTLLEMTAVLAIIGLLVGGILVGQSLLQNARIGRYGSDMLQYDAASQSFIARYRAWPGDMTTATQYWGIAAGTGNDTACQNFATASGSTATCNGNGNRIVSGVDGASELNERFRFWQHLANAGLIEGNFTGTAVTAGTNQTSLGVNVPRSTLENSGYTALSEYSGTALANEYFNTTAPINIIAAGQQVAGSDTYGANITASEARQLDTRFDDGRPAYGKIQSFRNSGVTAPGCTTTNVASTATYSLSAAGKICSIYLFLGAETR